MHANVGGVLAVNDLQKKTAQGIVNLFETGRLLGDYGAVTVVAGDAGHLSYGRSQTSLASGGLYALIGEYCALDGAPFAADLKPYLERLQSKDLTLDQDQPLRQLLKRAGADPLMRHAQDQFFDESYWAPANRLAANACKTSPVSTCLGITVIYDSVVHGSFARIRTQTDAAFAGTPEERDWIARYLEIRRAWLANHSNPGLRSCVYRMDELKKLADAGKWQLELPLTVRGVAIDEQSFLEKVLPDGA
jgi:chitosanase